MHLTAKFCHMKDAFDFAGKVVLVTGSSRGIGAGIIAAFGKLGARCVVNYVADAAGRNKADADRVATALGDARVIQCDVGDPEDLVARRHLDEELGHPGDGHVTLAGGGDVGGALRLHAVDQREGP